MGKQVAAGSLKKGSGKRTYENRTAPEGVTCISGEALFG